MTRLHPITYLVPLKAQKRVICTLRTFSYTYTYMSSAPRARKHPLSCSGTRALYEKARGCRIALFKSNFIFYCFNLSRTPTECFFCVAPINVRRDVIIIIIFIITVIIGNIHSSLIPCNIELRRNNGFIFLGSLKTLKIIISKLAPTTQSLYYATTLPVYRSKTRSNRSVYTRAVF